MNLVGVWGFQSASKPTPPSPPLHTIPIDSQVWFQQMAEEIYYFFLSLSLRVPSTTKHYNTRCITHCNYIYPFFLSFFLSFFFSCSESLPPFLAESLW